MMSLSDRIPMTGPWGASVITDAIHRRDMRIPAFIGKGDTIGVTAPSAGVTESTDRARLAHARARLEGRGYRVTETPDTYTCDEEGRSAPADVRAREWDSLVSDPGVRMVLAASGGDYEFEMLPLMDWELIESDPKWYQGYSDNTTLLFKITAEHDIATVYCGNFGDLGMEPLHPSVEQSLEFVEGRRLSQRSFPMHATGFADRVTGLEPFALDEATVWECTEGDSRFSGRLIGGCMDVVEWFVREGTADARDFVERYGSDGIVWYLETFDMTDVRVRDTLRRMRELGWMEDCTGVVLGRELFYSGGVSYRDAVMSELADMGVPVVFGADVGHKAPRMTFINGALATFDIRDGACELSYRLRSEGIAHPWHFHSRAMVRFLCTMADMDRFNRAMICQESHPPRMAFIGREKELSNLEFYFASDAVKTYAIYGRRRVGKTALIDRFCEGKPSIRLNFAGDDPGRILDHAAASIAEYTGEDADELRQRIDGFDDLLGMLGALRPAGRTVVVMDEFQDAMGAFKDVPACLMRYIDRELREQDVFLVLCGSSIPSMVRELNDYTRPLFQRFPLQLRLSPLSYPEARRFHPGLPEDEVIRMYAVAAGIPLYHEVLSAYPSAEEAIKGAFLGKTASLYWEARCALDEDASPLSTYHRVLSIIGGGEADINDIARRADLSRSRCREILDALEMLGIVARRPMYRGRRVPFYIRDGFLRFFHSVIHPNRALLDLGPSKAFQALRPHIDGFYGRRFEDVCSEYVRSTETCLWCGGWQGKAPVMDGSVPVRDDRGRVVTVGTDIDIVAKVTRGGLGLVMMCECKFTGRRCGVQELKELEERTRSAVFGGENLEYAIFSRSGFTSDLIDLSGIRADIRLVSLDDIGRWAGRERPGPRRSDGSWDMFHRRTRPPIVPCRSSSGRVSGTTLRSK